MVQHHVILYDMT